MMNVNELMLMVMYLDTVKEENWIKFDEESTIIYNMANTLQKNYLREIEARFA